MPTMLVPSVPCRFYPDNILVSRQVLDLVRPITLLKLLEAHMRGKWADEDEDGRSQANEEVLLSKKGIAESRLKTPSGLCLKFKTDFESMITNITL